MHDLADFIVYIVLTNILLPDCSRIVFVIFNFIIYLL